MFTHEPPDYECPFCAVQSRPGSRGWERNRIGWVFEEGSVFCIVPTHYWGVTKGNCLVMPKSHVENLYQIDEAIGIDLLRATKRLAWALKEALSCDGVSTRQHNEPAGNQDVWHFHQHVFPRYEGDDLYRCERLRYDDAERARYADLLREALRDA